MCIQNYLKYKSIGSMDRHMLAQQFIASVEVTFWGGSASTQCKRWNISLKDFAVIVLQKLYLMLTVIPSLRLLPSAKAYSKRLVMVKCVNN